MISVGKSPPSEGEAGNRTDSGPEEKAVGKGRELK